MCQGTNLDRLIFLSFTVSGSALDAFVVTLKRTSPFILVAYWQPEIQSYPGVNGGPPFPASTGKVTSIFAPSDGGQAQRYFVFIPDNAQNTFVVDVHVSRKAFFYSHMLN
jgi:hypothetical protein